MTIYEIKERTLETSPYFFSRATLKFFGQTLKSFSVRKQTDGRYLVTAPIYATTGQYGAKKRIGETVRYFNPMTNELERG